MRRRPKELTALSIVFLGIALYDSVQTIHVLDQPWSESATVESLILALLWALVPLTLRASRALWAVLALSAASIALERWGLAHASVLRFPVLWAPPILIAGLPLSRACRIAFFRPRRRWWLTPSRKRALLQTRLRPVLGGEILVQTFDISEGGLFIALTPLTQWHHSQAKLRQTPDQCLQVGAYCWLRVRLSEFSALTCTAEVVRKTTNIQGEYPAGIGLRFVGLTSQDRKVLLQFLKSVPQATKQATQQAATPDQLAA